MGQYSPAWDGLLDLRRNRRYAEAVIRNEVGWEHEVIRIINLMKLGKDDLIFELRRVKRHGIDTSYNCSCCKVNKFVVLNSSAI